MGVKETAAIGLTVIALATGVTQALDPATDPAEQRRQQQVQDLADSDQRSRDQMRDRGNDHVTAEEDRKRIPGPHRPPEKWTPKIKIKFRLP